MNRLLGLVGRDIKYSYSQVIADEYFKQNNINAHYSIFDISSVDDIDKIVVSNENLCGFNVTIPYKEAILPLLNSVSDEVLQIGAVNSVVVERDTLSPGKYSLKGYNTDYEAFKSVFESLKKPFHNSAIILGTGGAAKAVAYSFKLMDIPYLFVSRTKCDASTILYSNLSEVDFDKYNIIVNATPCGTSGFKNQLPPFFPFSKLRKSSLLIDLVYNPSVTPLMNECMKYGCVVENGLKMLQLQAYLFYRLLDLA